MGDDQLTAKELSKIMRENAEKSRILAASSRAARLSAAFIIPPKSKTYLVDPEHPRCPKVKN